ncbi:hypothetical protein Aspvir_002813 [Aspergillus viridinutans]|uniref:Uncharacterized protein n=1 Tax=Aspergillus viridinutans TaxID=75553 RepID=A0A9P3C6M1_ASPVI|nr:uncharacterized protein Aspvir_002813 [Aspergillus viridinutans]GIK07158.1 hypothetical protein Aspvir_002813 [Aspergillus viridinutans]
MPVITRHIGQISLLGEKTAGRDTRQDETASPYFGLRRPKGMHWRYQTLPSMRRTTSSSGAVQDLHRCQQDGNRHPGPGGRESGPAKRHSRLPNVGAVTLEFRPGDALAVGIYESKDVWLARWYALYVVDISHGLRVFDRDNVRKVESGDGIGKMARGEYSAANYAYVLPQTR